MFWRWLYRNGWDMERITGWMKGRKTGDGREMGKLARNDSYGVWGVDVEEMASDKEMSGLFHSFGKALAMDKVIKVGEERDAYWVQKWRGNERAVQFTL